MTPWSARHVLLAFLVLGTLYALSGELALYGFLVALLLLLLRHPRPERPPLDLCPPEADQLGDGHAGGPWGYQRTLAELLSLVGRRVQVLIAAGEADEWSVDLLGPLEFARNVGEDAERSERLFFAVGPESGFIVPREHFRAGGPLRDELELVGVFLHLGRQVDARIWVIDEQATAERQAAIREQRADR